MSAVHIHPNKWEVTLRISPTIMNEGTILANQILIIAALPVQPQANAVSSGTTRAKIVVTKNRRGLQTSDSISKISRNSAGRHEYGWENYPMS
jgi:hypothetical protein